MKKRDIGALVVGIGIILFVVFYILPVFGIEIPDPFRPSTTAYVSVYAACDPFGCTFIPQSTTVGFGAPRTTPMSILSLVGYDVPTQPSPITFILSAAIPSIPPEQIGIPSTSYRPSVLSWIPTCYLPGGGVDIAIRFSISELNYHSQLKPFGGFHWCGGDPNPFIQSFTFNYIPDRTYNWVAEIMNVKTGTVFYIVQGSQYLGG